jgi:hypothetical protein
LLDGVLVTLGVAVAVEVAVALGVGLGVSVTEGLGDGVSETVTEGLGLGVSDGGGVTGVQPRTQKVLCLLSAPLLPLVSTVTLTW